MCGWRKETAARYATSFSNYCLTVLVAKFGSVLNCSKTAQTAAYDDLLNDADDGDNKQQKYILHNHFSTVNLSVKVAW